LSQRDPEKKNIKIDFEPEGNATGESDAAAPAAEPVVIDSGNRSRVAGAGDVSLEAWKKLQDDNKDLLQTMQRRQADFDNYRRQSEQRLAKEHARGIETLAGKLLPVLDGFDLALAASNDAAVQEYSKGVEIIRKQLWDVLAKQGIERIDALGKPFNPHLHHAIESVETSEYPDGTVTQVLQQGYSFHDRVLRPAMVKVSSHTESAPSGHR
jgi:molecular chaperone GrpE